jgi:amino acid transporter
MPQPRPGRDNIAATTSGRSRTLPPVSKVVDSTKRVVLGRALKTTQLGETLLPKRLALPVFASDALSSNAYASQEILVVLAIGGAAFYGYAPWVAAAVVLVFFTVVASYRQIVHAYPSGGGDYEVVSKNLGLGSGVVVAGALLVDYVLTVAVSISAAVSNLASTYDWFVEHKVSTAIVLITVLSMMNLRGLRESGAAFAVPTYAFMVGIFGMLVMAVVNTVRGVSMRAESADWTVVPEATGLAGVALVFVVLRAFSSGTTALTGVEAIGNGVPAFRKPKSKNAATTLLLLGLISMTMFAGITWLALATGVQVTESDDDLQGLPEGGYQKTVIVQVADAVFGSGAWPAVYVSLATMLILVLAANTAFNGFPVLGSILARDGFLPRQFHTRGDRLAFSNGIIALAVVAGLLVAIYRADVTQLIQLYIIGVFISFTLSQLGMVRHWTHLLTLERRPGVVAQYRRARAINAFGMCLTGTVLVIVLATKFTRGAWIVVVAIPLLVLLMRSIHGHYEKVTEELRLRPDDPRVLPSRVHGVILVSSLNRATLRAIQFAQATRPSTLEALTAAVEQPDVDGLTEQWVDEGIQVPLKVLHSPYREVTRPILEYVRAIRRASPRDVVTVFIPEYVVGKWWEALLHNQSALRLRARLHFTPGVMVVSVPYMLASAADADKPDAVAPGAIRRGETASAQAVESAVADEMRS